MAVSKAMKDAFRDGFSNPGAPLSPGEQRLLRARAGPRVILVEDAPEELPAVQIGELTHRPYTGDGEVIEAEIID